MPFPAFAWVIPTCLLQMWGRAGMGASGSDRGNLAAIIRRGVTRAMSVRPLALNCARVRDLISFHTGLTQGA